LNHGIGFLNRRHGKINNDMRGPISINLMLAYTLCHEKDT
jgi:hypothetical protein